MNYDIFFISYDETNADENWARVQELHPCAQRVNNIASISGAHMRCNDLATTERFWTIDGDNWILCSLPTTVDTDFDLLFFNALDPVDGHTSSIGGVKLWKKDSFTNTGMVRGDFCKFATKTSTVVQYTLSEHRYNSTPYESWRHSFRHMAKCFAGIITHDVLDSNIQRFKTHQKTNIWSYQGYIDAEIYVRECRGDFDKINLINDYNWLEQYFITTHRASVDAIEANN